MASRNVKRFLAVLAAGTMLCSGFPVNLNMNVHAAEATQAEEFAATFANAYAQVGTALSVNVAGATDVTYQWYVDGKVVSDEASYTPTVADLEKWIEVVVTKEDKSEESRAKLYCSKLPVVYIDTENGASIVSKEDYINATMKIQGNDKFDPEETTLYSGAIEIRGRGNSTWSQPKKPYKIKLDKKTSVFDMGKNKHWVLLANYMDESLMRNTMAYNLSGDMGMEHMDTVWVDVILNGKYIGNYQFCEQVRVDETRVDIFDWEGLAEDSADVIAEAQGLDAGDLADFMNENMEWITTGKVVFEGKTYNIADYPDIEIPSINGGYLLELDGYYDEVSKFKTDASQPIMFKNPEFVNTNDEMMAYVKSYVQAFEDAVKADDYIAKYEGEDVHYSDLYDFDSLVDYWLINEIFFNEEIAKKSTYMYKEIDGLMMMGPIWDMDWSSGGEGNTYKTDRWATDYFVQGVQADNWYRDLVKDPYFLMKAQERYWEIREEIQEMLDVIDTNTAYLKESGAANSAIWTGRQSFDSDVKGLKTWMNSHVTWMDAQMATEDSLCNSFAGLFTNDENIKVTLQDVSGKALTADNAETAPADVLAEEGKDIVVTVKDNTGIATAATIFVNGKKAATIPVDASEVTYTITTDKLTAAIGEKDVIEVKMATEKGYSMSNFVTVKATEKAEIVYPNDLNFLTYCDNENLKDWNEPTWEAVESQRQEMKKFIEENIVTDQMNDYQKAKAIYTWIAANVRYADQTESLSAVPYDVFTNKVAVCGGYSNLYKEMLNLIDIPAVVLVGNTIQGPHAWNAVYADDRWFYADTTWGNSEGMKWFDMDFASFNSTHGTLRIEDAVVEAGEVLLGYDGGIAVVGVKDGVKSVTIPETYEDIKIANISYQLFNAKYGLEELNIGKNIQLIDTQLSSSTLKAINVSADNAGYASKDGVLFTKDMKSILVYPAGKTDESFVLPKETDSLDLKETFGNEYLKALEVEAGNASYAAEAGLLYNKDKSELLFVPAGQEKVEILENAVINDMAFVNVDKSKVTIYAETDSPAHRYAVANNIAFVSTSACKHTNKVVKDKVEATCIKEGYTGDVYCEDCKEVVETGKKVEKEAHKWAADYTIDKEATCTEAGSKSKHCTTNGCTEKTDVTAIAKVAHAYGDWKVEKEPTCTEEGVKFKECECGDKQTEAIAKVAHAYGDWTVVKEPTAQEEGLKEKTCRECGVKIQDTVAKLPQIEMPEEKPEKEPEKEPETVQPSSPVTGDTNTMALYSLIMLCAAVIILKRKNVV